MEKAKVFLHKCILDSQDFGSDHKHMISRIFFNIHIGEKKFNDLHVDIHQSAGSKVGSHISDLGKLPECASFFDREKFRKAIEEYYRSLESDSVSRIGIGAGNNLRLWNITIEKQATVELEIEETSGTE